jgi:hypothetical protein
MTASDPRKASEAQAKLDARKAREEREAAAAAAAQASTTRAPSHGWFLEHDGLVTVFAMVLLLAGWFSYRTVTKQKTATFDRQGLTFTYPAGWFPNDPNPEAFPVNVSFAAIEPTTKVEAKISKKPAFDGPIESVLDLSRSRQYGELYKKFTTEKKTVAGKEWLRSDFAYAFKKSDDDTPRVAAGVEYAVVNNENLYVVTIHGPEGKVKDLERDVLGTVSLK